MQPTTRSQILLNYIFTRVFEFQTFLHINLIIINPLLQLHGLDFFFFFFVGVGRSDIFGMVLCSSLRSLRREVLSVI
jgi:hypothetical protein